MKAQFPQVGEKIKKEKVVSKDTEAELLHAANLVGDLPRDHVRLEIGDLGVDLKYALTQGLTLDVTVNTDFAQVEADEQQINLTRFSLFFPEKREFFLENQGTFSFGGVSTAGAGDVPVLFYSRRVGLNAGRLVPLDAGGRDNVTVVLAGLDA